MSDTDSYYSDNLSVDYNYFGTEEEDPVKEALSIASGLSLQSSVQSEDQELHERSKKDETSCKFRTPCIKDFKDALVDNTKEDPLFYTTLSGVTAAVGLATNSPATIIGSMLLSPIGDVIVRLSLILNFNAQRHFGKTTNDFSRQAFQEQFLDNLGIPSKYLYINNDKDNKLNIQLKSIDPEVKGRIDEIYKYRGKIYFSYNSDYLLYDVHGDPKFIVRREEEEYKRFKNNEIRKLEKEKDKFVPTNKKGTDIERIYKIPGNLEDQPNISAKLHEMINELNNLRLDKDSIQQKNNQIRLESLENKLKELSGDFESISIEYISMKMRYYEKQDVIPWTTDTYIGKKYKFWDVFGWGIVICIWAIVIGIICAICFGLFHISQQKEKEEALYKINQKIKEATTPEDKIELQKEKEKIENERIPWFSIPTIEMIDRTKIENAIGMIFIAICAGIILPEAVRHKNATKMVGIGIATALLPPLVNIGMYFGIMILLNINEENREHLGMSMEDARNAVLTGFVIFFINFGLMLGISTYRLYNLCNAQENSIFKAFGLC